MATTLYLLDSVDVRLGDNLNLKTTRNVFKGLSLGTSRGGGAVSQAQNTENGPTSGLEIGGAGGLREWLTPPLAAAVTISGQISYNIRAAESGMTANVAINCILQKVDGATGALTTIVQTNNTSELGTSEAASACAGPDTPTSTACKKGDRLRLRVYGDDAGTMLSGLTFTVWWNGPTAGASGDSYITLTENLSFVSEPAGSTIYLTNTAVSLGATDPPLLSDFQGTDENPLSEGGNWAELDLIDSPLQRTGGLVTSGGAGVGASYWTPDDFGPDLEAHVWFENYVGGQGIIFRAQNAGGSGTWDGYCVITSGTNSLNFLRVADGGETIIDQVTTPAWADSYRLGVRVEGSRITAFRNTGSGWECVASVVDTTYAAAGKVGLQANNASGTMDMFYVGNGVSGLFITEQEAWTSRGGGLLAPTTSSQAGWVFPIQACNGYAALDWYTKPLQAFTLSGAARVNLRAREGDAPANAGILIEIARVDGDGNNQVPWAIGWADPELSSTAETVYSFLVGGDDLAISNGQRLRLRVMFDDGGLGVGLMVVGYNLTLYYNGTSGGASGDTYVTFPQTLTEYVAVTSKVRYPAVIGQAVARASSWFRRHDGILLPGRRVWRPD